MTDITNQVYAYPTSRIIWYCNYYFDTVETYNNKPQFNFTLEVGAYARGTLYSANDFQIRIPHNIFLTYLNETYAPSHGIEESIDSMGSVDYRKTSSDFGFDSDSSDLIIYFKNEGSASLNSDPIIRLYNGKYYFKFSSNPVESVKKEITVNYYNVSGTKVGSATATLNNPFTLRSTTVSQTGYKSDGWYSESGSFFGQAGESTEYFKIENSALDLAPIINLYERQSLRTYTLTYDANGGTVSPSSKSITYSKEYGALATPVREGYVFDGWYTAKTGGSQVTSSTIHNTLGDVTIYAHWSIIYVTVTYNGNGGTPSRASDEVAFGQSTALPTATRTGGYRLLGWYTASSGGNKVGDANTSYSPTSSITLYAQWIKTYVVSYKFNGGSTADYSETHDVNTRITLPSGGSRQYYNFDGWYTSQTGGTRVGGSGDAYTVTADITLHAQWVNQTATIVFNGNGGTPSEPSREVYKNVAFTLPNATRPHYGFKGWYTSQTGGTRIGGEGDTYTITANTTVYAQWDAIEYTLTFVSTETNESITVKGSASSPLTVPSPKSRPYYTFNGWVNGSETLSAGTSYVPTANLTYTAKWTGITYDLTFVHYTGVVTTMTDVQGGTVIKLPTGKTDWTDSQYYQEVGWYTTLDSLTYLKSNSDYTVTRNETLTMKWVGRQYTVSFASEGGTVPQSISYTYPSEITLPDAIKDYAYHTFTAWNDGQSDYSANSKYNPKGNVTFTAKWGLQRYTVTYASSGESGVQVPNAVTVDALTEITLGTPSRPHYDPTYWYDAKTGGNKVGTVGGKYTVRADITLYPRWTPTQYTVSFSVPSGLPSIASLVGSVEKYVTLPNISGTLSDKTFNGWKISGSDTLYKVNQAYYPSSNVTFVADYSDNYIVKFYRNHTASDTTIIRTDSVSPNNSIKLSKYPSADGYYCTGWYTARSGGTRIGGEDSTFTPTASTDLYAHWQNCPTVTFDANGGLVNGATKIQVVTSGQSTFTIPVSRFPTDVSRPYHRFDGWYLNGTKYDVNSTYTESVTLQARWTEVRVERITLSVNGSTDTVTLSDFGVVSQAKANITSNIAGLTPDLSKLVWSSSNESQLSVYPDESDPTSAKVIPKSASGTVTVVLTCSVTYSDSIVKGTINLILTQDVTLTLLNDYGETQTLRVDNDTHLPIGFPTIAPTRDGGYVFNAWLDVTTNELITKDTPILYNKRAKANWFKSYDQWDKDNLIIQLFNDDGTAIIKQFAMGTVGSITPSYRVSPSSIPTPMQTSESTFLIDTAVTMTIDAECSRKNPDVIDDTVEDYNLWSNTKWINELMALVDRWQGQSDGVKVLYLPNDCKVHDTPTGKIAYGQFYPLIGTVSEDGTGFLYKGVYYQGKNAYITSFTRSIDQTNPEVTSVTIGFAIGGLKSRYVQ